MSVPKQERSDAVLGLSGVAVGGQSAVALSPLSDLARSANAEHEACRDAAQTAVAHAIKAGEYLNAAKAQVGHGGWMQWLDENFGATHGTAKVYMRLHAHAEAVKDAPSVSTALAQIATERVVYSPELARKVRAAVRAGESQRAVAERFGLSQPTVSHWMDPKREQARAVKRRRETQAGRRAAHRAEAERLSRRVKGPTTHAYASIRKALQALQAAEDEAPNAEARTAIQAAMRSLYNAEDSVGQALRAYSITDLRAVAA